MKCLLLAFVLLQSYQVYCAEIPNIIFDKKHVKDITKEENEYFVRYVVTFEKFSYALQKLNNENKITEQQPDKHIILYWDNPDLTYKYKKPFDKGIQRFNTIQNLYEQYFKIIRTK